MKKKIVSGIILLGTVITTVLNVVMYNQLPDKLGLQLSTSGDMQNHIPKNYFILLIPVILLVDLMYSIKSDDEDQRSPLIIGLVAVGLNIFTIMMNT